MRSVIPAYILEKMESYAYSYATSQYTCPSTVCSSTGMTMHMSNLF